MTRPAQARSGRPGRYYAWPPTPPHEFEAPSVTAILKTLPKEWLVYWALKEAATYVADNRWALAKLDYDGIIEVVKRAPWRGRDKKADIGTAAHAAIETHLAGGSLLELDGRSEGYALAGLSFLEDWHIGVVHSEATVYSREHGYAGTLDLIGRVGDSRLPTLIDFKTGKNAYPETALQLAAYAHADFIGTADGRELPMPTVGHACVVLLRPDGTYEVRPAEIGAVQFETFLKLKWISDRWLGDESKRAIGPPLTVPGEEGAT